MPHGGTQRRPHGANNLTGSHTIGGAMPSRLLGRVRYHDWNKQPVRHHVEGVAKPTRCMFCGQQVKKERYHNPLTGTCLSTRMCAERRADYDDATIEFLGLVPREKGKQ